LSSLAQGKGWGERKKGLAVISKKENEDSQKRSQGKASLEARKCTSFKIQGGGKRLEHALKARPSREKKKGSCGKAHMRFSLAEGKWQNIRRSRSREGSKDTFELVRGRIERRA